MAKFWFTFGRNHNDQDKRPLGDKFCVIEAETEMKARQVMTNRRGNKYSMSYESAEQAGVEEYHLTEVYIENL